MDNKIDPIGKLYYDPLETAETAGDKLLYFLAVLSFLLLIVSKDAHPKIYDNLQILFVLGVIVSALLNLFSRLYLSPRAQEKRYQDFLSSAYGAHLTPERTKGYYNNSTSTPTQRLGAQLLENTFHSKDTARLMTIGSRWFVLVYFIVFVLLILNRSSNLEIISFAAQIFFGEQVLSKWARIEWTRKQFDTVFINLYQLLAKKLPDSETHVHILEMLQKYEVAKATTGVTLSKKIFLRRNQVVSEDWANIRKDLNL